MNDSPRTSSCDRKRVFWLGMHKVLVKTELPRLRALGYEVFNPPYLSDVVDQSAAPYWSWPTDSSLPVDIIAKLSTYNFFYNSISSEIADILNSFFDYAIVTINPDWLIAFLKAYKRPIIYRVYGQPYCLSQYFANARVLQIIDERENFWFVPHVQQAATIEDSWLKYRMRVVPYSLGDEVFQLTDTWGIDGIRKEIGLMCPRIDNQYYADSYRYVKKHFNRRHFSIFGVQVEKVRDPQVVGTLGRKELLSRFAQLAGFFYHYKEPAVAYLPPLEMMEIGGPVIYFPQSLLGRMFGKNTPGAAYDEDDAHRLAGRLLGRDRGLIAEMVASQLPVRRLYEPEYVWPIFDSTFQELLGPVGRNEAPQFLFDSRKKPTAAAPPKSMLVLFHRLGFSVTMDNGRYTSAEGVARVARMIVRALAERTDLDFVVTSRVAELGKVLGFFQEVVPDVRRVRVLTLDGGLGKRKQPGVLGTWLLNVRAAMLGTAKNIESLVTRCGTWLYLRADPSVIRLMLPLLVIGAVATKLPGAVASQIRRTYLRVRRLYRERKRKLSSKATSDYRYWKLSRQSRYIDKVNSRSDIRFALVPHYYLFPESTRLKKPFMLYLPDHMPSLMQEGSFGSQFINDKIGLNVAQKAKTIITNSNFSAEYMPGSPLRVDISKLRIFPLPNINNVDDDVSDQLETSALPYDISNRQFVFYPTQNRPNKRLALLAQAVAIAALRLRQARAEYFDEETGDDDSQIDLVLTCPQDNTLVKLAGTVPVKFLTGVSDLTLKSLYRRAGCLCFTSIAEGNFPTQILEALTYRLPIVAVRMPLITSELGARADELLLVDGDDPVQLAQGIVHCLDHRSDVISKQETLRDYVLERHSWHKFADSVQQTLSAL